MKNAILKLSNLKFGIVIPMIISLSVFTTVSYSKSDYTVATEISFPKLKNDKVVEKQLKRKEVKSNHEYLKKIKEFQQQNEDQIFESVEQNPEFNGGMAKMFRFLGENIAYPKAAQKAKISGRVFVRFVVEKDGSIGNVEVLKGIGFGCDEEAIRVIKAMPKWNPGIQNGKPVRVFYKMPIVYKMN